MWAECRPGALPAWTAGTELGAGSRKQLPRLPGTGEPGLWVGRAASRLMGAHLRGLLLGGPSRLLQLLLQLPQL